MKKRIVCVLLALIMLIGMLPMSASAAGMAVSERAITVLKQLQKYSSECTDCGGGEYRIGYGTICTCSGAHGGTHTDFNEKVADKALRSKLTELDAAVNSFASNAGLSLTQGQHDALVVLSYDIGTSWLNGSGVLRSAVVNGLTGNDFLNAIGQSSAYGSDTTDKITGATRRMIEANMYLNGAYSNVAPSNYTYVDYDAAGGTMAEGTNGKYRQYFDLNSLAKPAPVPTKANHIFLGWYDTEAWVPNLGRFQVAKNLVAKWQPVGTTYQNAAPVNTYLLWHQMTSPYIYTTPDVYSVTANTCSNGVTLDRDFIDSNGARWSRIAGTNNWLLISGSEKGANSAFEIDVTVTVTNSTVRSRANASITSAQNGTYKQGDQLRIVNTEMGSGYLWGQVVDTNGIATGWVALMYTNWNEVKDNPTGSNAPNATDIIATAVVNCAGYLNVRSEAGADNAIVGALADGDHVDIYEIKFVNGHKWGRTSGGWILLTYAQVTMLNTNLDYSNSADVLAYTFTGTLKNAVTAHTDVAHNSDLVGKEMAAGTVVAVSMVKNDTDGNIWGFNGTGWIKLDNVNMDVAKYVVVSDSVTVRESANSSSTGIEKIVKGVEMDITDIKVVDATIWGKTEKYGGWVNLASKYVQRSNAPIIENVASTSQATTGLIATVINTDKVNVRNTGATYGKILGSLTRGTTVLVWDGSEENGWYKLDTNKNGTFEEDGDGWVSGQYLDVMWGTIGGSTEDTTTDSTTGTTGTTNAAVETGLGIVANTYTGVNVRTGAGTGYAATGKILTGTTVEILEVTPTATSKWGRTAQGWVCMDYITMVSKYPIGGSTEVEEKDPNAGQNVGGSTSNTEGNTTTTSTPAIYTGTVIADGVQVLKTADADALSVRTLSAGENITIQELVKVTTKTTETVGTTIDGNATTETNTVTVQNTYWARVNGGWIADPADTLTLNTLDQITYTVANSDEVTIYKAAGGDTYNNPLKKGTQVTVTTLQIVGDKVWGFVEDYGTSGGWVRLDQLSEGAITIKNETASNNTNNTTTNNNTTTIPPLGIGSNTGGYVNNTRGYRYTGKVINTNQVNVRSMPSTGSAITTTMKHGAGLVVYETTINENMAWGRCDAGWIYLYYVDLTPAIAGAVDARVVYNDNTIIYTDANCSGIAGTYARMSVIDIYEIVGTMARTDQGWVSTNDLL